MGRKIKSRFAYFMKREQNLKKAEEKTLIQEALEARRVIAEKSAEKPAKKSAKRPAKRSEERSAEKPAENSDDADIEKMRNALLISIAKRDMSKHVLTNNVDVEACIANVLHME